MTTSTRIISVNPCFKPLGELMTDAELRAYRCPREIKRRAAHGSDTVWRYAGRLLGDWPATTGMNSVLAALRCAAALLLLGAFGWEAGLTECCIGALLISGTLCRPASAATAVLCVTSAMNPAGVAAATLCAALVPLGAGRMSADGIWLRALARRRARRAERRLHLDYRLFRRM